MKADKIFITILSSLPLICVLLFVVMNSRTDNDIWKETIKHSDEFVFDHMSYTKRFVNMTLYDQDSTYVCEAFMDLRYKKVTIFKETEVIGSSVNWMKSRKMYRILYDKIPDEIVTPNNPKKEVLKKLKNM